MRRLGRLADHGSERTKVGGALRREKSGRTVDGVTTITAEEVTVQVILVAGSYGSAEHGDS